MTVAQLIAKLTAVVNNDPRLADTIVQVQGSEWNHGISGRVIDDTDENGTPRLLILNEDEDYDAPGEVSSYWTKQGAF